MYWLNLVCYLFGVVIYLSTIKLLIPEAKEKTRYSYVRAEDLQRAIRVYKKTCALGLLFYGITAVLSFQTFGLFLILVCLTIWTWNDLKKAWDVLFG